MGIAVIGAGFGRTGTMSLKVALEALGFGRCYHMVEVIENPEHRSFWLQAADGAAVAWDGFFGGYGAVVDWPGCYFWKELSAHYPEAKVILTLRDSERWYQSAYDTIYQAMRRRLAGGQPLPAGQADMSAKIILEQTFQGRFEDREHAIAVYERHNQEVQDLLPAERLLVYQVSEGWAPLCRFLDLPVPDAPFPKVNTAAEFHANFGTR